MQVYNKKIIKSNPITAGFKVKLNNSYTHYIHITHTVHTPFFLIETVKSRFQLKTKMSVITIARK